MSCRSHARSGAGRHRSSAPNVDTRLGNERWIAGNGSGPKDDAAHPDCPSPVVGVKRQPKRVPGTRADRQPRDPPRGRPRTVSSSTAVGADHSVAASTRRASAHERAMQSSPSARRRLKRASPSPTEAAATFAAQSREMPRFRQALRRRASSQTWSGQSRPRRPARRRQRLAARGARMRSAPSLFRIRTKSASARPSRSSRTTACTRDPTG